jgi:tRNA1(Val) A37 N6-methylase TrmN6
MASDEVTEDLIYGGRVKVRQPARGYRVNGDTILLAAAVEAPAGARVLEAGCGVGGALIAAAVRLDSINGLGVERDDAMADLARVNVAANGLQDRLAIRTGDALDRAADIGVFDAVFFNPPFDAEGEGRAPAESRRAAHVAVVPIEAWIAALADRLSGGGVLTLIHRAAKLPDILAALEGRLGGAEIYPVRPRAEAPAKRVIARAFKGSRAPLRLLKGLDLHDASGAKHTPEAEAILRGEATIHWR